MIIISVVGGNVNISVPNYEPWTLAGEFRLSLSPVMEWGLNWFGNKQRGVISV